MPKEIGGKMESNCYMTDIQSLHNQINQELRTLHRELERLGVRQSAIERFRLAVSAQKSIEEIDDEDESVEEIVSNLEAIMYDLTTFKEQLKERLEHSEQGLRMVLMLRNEKSAIAFYQYIQDEVKLCLRDAKVAREGYDELITNIKEIAKLRDQ